MNTDYKAHVGHRVTLDEYVEQQWELQWEDGEPKRVQTTQEIVIDTIDPRMFCWDCDLYLTGYDVSVI